MSALKHLLTAILIVAASASFGQDKIKVLIVDGVNNHNWKKTTEATKGSLDKCGRFVTTVSTSPDKKAPKEDWDKWRPKFSDYDVVLSNFNDGGKTKWSKETQADFERFISEGGGFVPIHAADNSSSDWPAYNEMIAVGGWGGRKAGKSGQLLRLVDGKWQACCSDKGGSGSHGPQHEFMVKHDVPDHPILAGLPTEWKHAKDELYDSLRGPTKNVTVLAHAYSNKSKENEPMVMEIKYGKGTVIHIPMGHYNGQSCECVGFQTIMVRSVEYAATGKVTIKAPKNFPGKDKAVVVAPAELDWN
jgi:type 1 glutamine amidotransferase